MATRLPALAEGDGSPKTPLGEITWDLISVGGGLGFDIERLAY